jgi:hypothetical protein
VTSLKKSNALPLDYMYNKSFKLKTNLFKLIEQVVKEWSCDLCIHIQTMRPFQLCVMLSRGFLSYYISFDV